MDKINFNIFLSRRYFQGQLNDENRSPGDLPFLKWNPFRTVKREKIQVNELDSASSEGGQPLGFEGGSFIHLF